MLVGNSAACRCPHREGGPPRERGGWERQARRCGRHCSRRREQGAPKPTSKKLGDSGKERNSVWLEYKENRKCQIKLGLTWRGPLEPWEDLRFYPKHSGDPERSDKFRFTFLNVLLSCWVENGVRHGQVGQGVSWMTGDQLGRCWFAGES